MARAVVEDLPFADDRKEYIVKVLDPILEEMVSDLLTDMPKHPSDFMILWLRKRSGLASSSRESLMQANSSLKSQMRNMTSTVEEAIGPSVKAEDTEEEENDDDDDDCDELPEHFRKPEAQMGQGRQSVSAEAYGTWNQKKNFTPPKNVKSDEQKQRLNAVLSQVFMFKGLEPQDMETILLAMKEVRFAVGKKVLNEGDDGDYMFVIETGSLDCIKAVDGESKTVKTCAPGDVFGELALLYNCPRAASVVARDDCVCWQLDRESFNHIVKDAAVKRREKHERFLKMVALISSIDAYQRSQIADALVTETFNKGDVIVKQGDSGDKFYIVEDGSLYATKSSPADGERRVMEYKIADYFGELALLKNQPRAASVIVESTSAKVLSLSRVSFSKMLGPLQEVLSRQAANYS